MKFGPNEAPVRLHASLGYNASDDGRAVLLHLDTAQGPLALEIPEEKLKELLTHLLSGSVRAASMHSGLPKMPKRRGPEYAVEIPAEDFSVNTTPGGKQMVSLVGLIELTYAVPTAAAKAIASALT